MASSSSYTPSSTTSAPTLARTSWVVSSVRGLLTKLRGPVSSPGASANGWKVVKSPSVISRLSTGMVSAGPSIKAAPKVMLMTRKGRCPRFLSTATSFGKDPCAHHDIGSLLERLRLCQRLGVLLGLLLGELDRALDGRRRIDRLGLRRRVGHRDRTRAGIAEGLGHRGVLRGGLGGAQRVRLGIPVGRRVRVGDRIRHRRGGLEDVGSPLGVGELKGDVRRTDEHQRLERNVRDERVEAIRIIGRVEGLCDDLPRSPDQPSPSVSARTGDVP